MLAQIFSPKVRSMYISELCLGTSMTKWPWKVFLKRGILQIFGQISSAGSCVPNPYPSQPMSYIGSLSKLLMKTAASQFPPHLYRKLLLTLFLQAASQEPPQMCYSATRCLYLVLPHVLRMGCQSCTRTDAPNPQDLVLARFFSLMKNIFQND